MRRKKREELFKTENVLNRSNWIDGDGTVHELKDMEKSHLQNVLYFIYKRRDRYWLNCNDASLIEKYQDGDEFFQLVIRKSVIWQAIIKELSRPAEGFNFEFVIPSKEVSPWAK